MYLYRKTIQTIYRFFEKEYKHPIGAALPIIILDFIINTFFPHFYGISPS